LFYENTRAKIRGGEMKTKSEIIEDIIENKENIEEEICLIRAIKNLGLDECLILLRDNKRKSLQKSLTLQEQNFQLKIKELEEKK